MREIWVRPEPLPWSCSLPASFLEGEGGYSDGYGIV